MPKTKNQAKNKSRFEIRGGVLNEYEFALNEGAMTEEERNRFAQAEEERQAREGEEAAEAPLPTSPQEREAERIREVIETAHEKAQRNIGKRERGAVGRGKKGAKKISKAVKKAGAKKKAAKNSGKAAVSKKAGAGKGVGAGKKGAGKKGAKKSGGTNRGGAARKGGAGKGAGRKSSTKRGGRT